MSSPREPLAPQPVDARPVDARPTGVDPLDVGPVGVGPLDARSAVAGSQGSRGSQGTSDPPLDPERRAGARPVASAPRRRTVRAARRASGEELRAAILAEARRVIVTEGVGALSTRRIARAVGCTATSIYLYFESKDALLHAVIDEGMQALHAYLEAARADDAGAGSRVQGLARAYVAFALEHPTLYEVMFMLHPRHMERYPAESYRRARRNVELLAAALADDGEPSADLHRATTIWAALHGHVALWIAGRIDATIPRETFIAGALKLVRPRGA